jgi:hypothetical protein
MGTEEPGLPCLLAGVAVKPLFRTTEMSLTREEIKSLLEQWNLAWDSHDLEGIMKLFPNEVLFENLLSAPSSTIQGNLYYLARICIINV